MPRFKGYRADESEERRKLTGFKKRIKLVEEDVSLVSPGEEPTGIFCMYSPIHKTEKWYYYKGLYSTMCHNRHHAEMMMHMNGSAHLLSLHWGQIG